MSAPWRGSQIWWIRSLTKPLILALILLELLLCFWLQFNIPQQHAATKRNRRLTIGKQVSSCISLIAAKNLSGEKKKKLRLPKIYQRFSEKSMKKSNLSHTHQVNMLSLLVVYRAECLQYSSLDAVLIFLRDSWLCMHVYSYTLRQSTHKIFSFFPSMVSFILLVVSAAVSTLTVIMTHLLLDLFE